MQGCFCTCRGCISVNLYSDSWSLMCIRCEWLVYETTFGHSSVLWLPLILLTLVYVDSNFFQWRVISYVQTMQTESVNLDHNSKNKFKSCGEKRLEIVLHVILQCNTYIIYIYNIYNTYTHSALSLKPGPSLKAQRLAWQYSRGDSGTSIVRWLQWMGGVPLS